MFVKLSRVTCGRETENKSLQFYIGLTRLAGQKIGQLTGIMRYFRRGWTKFPKLVGFFAFGSSRLRQKRPTLPL